MGCAAEAAPRCISALKVAATFPSSPRRGHPLKVRSPGRSAGDIGRGPVGELERGDAGDEAGQVAPDDRMGAEVRGRLDVIVDVRLEQQAEAETIGSFGQGADELRRPIGRDRIGAELAGVAGGGVGGGGGEAAAGQVAGRGEGEGSVAAGVGAEVCVAQVELAFAVAGGIRDRVPVEVDEVAVAGGAVERARDEGGAGIAEGGNGRIVLQVVWAGDRPAGMIGGYAKAVFDAADQVEAEVAVVVDGVAADGVADGVGVVEDDAFESVVGDEVAGAGAAEREADDVGLGPVFDDDPLLGVAEGSRPRWRRRRCCFPG